jgi:hypothetical protein
MDEQHKRVRGDSTRTRRMVAGAAVPAVVCVLTLAFCGKPDAAPPEAAGRSGPPSSPATIVHGELDLQFADPEHGYAITNECNIAGTCRLRLRTTSDGGRTWHSAELPAADDGRAQELGKDGSPQIDPISSTVVIFRDRTPVPTLEPGVHEWITTDGARTWRPVEHPKVLPSGPEIPAGALIDAPFGVGTWDNEDRLVTVRPDGTGFVAVVPAQPAFEFGPVQRRAAADGSYWAACRTEPEHRPCAASTRDAGRTWTVTGPPYADPLLDPGWNVGLSVSAADGRNVCLSYRYWFQPIPGAGPDAEPNIASHLACSSDAGATWRFLALPQGTLGSAAVLVGGDVLASIGSIYSDTKLYRLPVGGSRFEPVTAVPSGVSELQRSGGRLVVRRLWVSPQYFHSVDGITWRPLW